MYVAYYLKIFLGLLFNLIFIFMYYYYLILFIYFFLFLRHDPTSSAEYPFIVLK